MTAGLVTVVPVPTAQSSARPAPVARVLTVADAVDGPALPVRPRVPNAALLVGADDTLALYHSGHVDPATDRVDHTLVSLADGHVVRTFQPPRGIGNVRLVDGSVVVVDAGTATRYDAATGAVTGSLVGIDGWSALDDEWVMTTSAVRWFDGRVVPLTESLPSTPFSLRVLGDSDLAVLASFGGFDPVAVTPASGVVTDLERSGEDVTVFAASGGADPVLWGTRSGTDEDGIVRWSDPAHDDGRTVIPSDLLPFGGGVAGDRVLVHLGGDSGEYVAALDATTGAAGPPLADVVTDLGLDGDPPALGDAIAQAGDGLVVSGDSTPQGELVLVGESAVRTLGAPVPSPLAATRLYRSAAVVQADFRENGSSRGSAEHVLGGTGWTPVSGPVTPPAVPADPGAEALAACTDPTDAPTVVDVRGRWQLERCSAAPAGAQFRVTDRDGVVATYAVCGSAPQLGEDHVVSLVQDAPGGPVALAVARLDEGHERLVYGPLSGAPAFSVDLTDGGAPVYADAHGQARLAPVPEPTEEPTEEPVDSTAPAIRELRRPPVDVRSVLPVDLTYVATATDAVDGDDVEIRVQVRRARRGAALGSWQTRTDSSDGSVTITAQPGEQWCFRAIAADRSGNVAIGREAPCSTVPVDDLALPSRASKILIARRMLGGSATPLSGREHLTVPAVPSARAVLWLATGPRLGRVLVFAGARRVLAVDVRTPQVGRRRVVVPVTGARLTVRPAGPRAVLVDAVGQRRLP